MPKKILLMIGNRKEDATIMENIFSDEYDIVACNDALKVTTVLNDPEIHISLVMFEDYESTVCVDTIKYISDNALLGNFPIFLIVEKEEFYNIDEDYLSYVFDVLVKPFNTAIIKKRIENALSLYESKNILGRHITKLETTDVLTGLVNEDEFCRLSEKILKDDKSGRYVIVMADIYHFNVLNEIYGRNKGDEILISFAEALREIFSENKSVIARLNSDVFAVTALSEGINLVRFEEKFKNFKNKNKILSLAVVHYGIYSIDDVNLDIHFMLHRAEIALNTIKDKSNQHYAFYNEELRMRLMEEQRITSLMDNALESKEFVVYYQPIWHVKEKVFLCAEALVRWIREGEIISPHEFIPLFEKNGFIFKLDWYVYEEVCRQIAQWLDMGFEVIPISVNVSPLHIAEEDFTERLVALVKKYGISNKYLKIELTERSYSLHDEKLKNVIDKLHGFGFQVLIDDLGSDYSSFSSVLNLPADIIKVDSMFIKNIEFSAKYKGVLEGILATTEKLGMPVVIEGAETKAQVKFAVDNKCYAIQGYYFSKPVTATEFEKIVFLGQFDKTLLEFDFTSVVENELSDKDYKDAVSAKFGAMYKIDMLKEAVTVMFINDSFSVSSKKTYGLNEFFLEKSEEIAKEDRAVFLIKTSRRFIGDLKSSGINNYRFFVHTENVYDSKCIEFSYIINSRTDNLIYMAVQDVTENRKKEIEQQIRENELMKLANFDSLTSLLSRQAFVARFQEKSERSPRGKACALIMLDIDNFKKINDLYGHIAGDKVLVKLAKKITEHFGKIGICGRLGGDEFIIYTDKYNDKKELCEKLDVMLKDISSTHMGSDIFISASAGIAFAESEYPDFDTLYSKADKALYKIKNSGKNAFNIYDNKEIYEK